jgi:cytochrome c oxidase subunit 3
MNTTTVSLPIGGGAMRPMPHAGSVGLWAFIGVASALFALFITAYAMRMQSGDWVQIAMPWQLWLSSAMLVAGSVLLHLAGRAGRKSRWSRARVLLLAGGLCSLVFVCVQLWAWQALQSARVSLTGNPSASFFYLLTAMHGLHVLGGLAAWGMTLRRFQPDSDRTRRAIALCARYWHFLLAVWGLLFAALGWLTPEIVAYICGTEVPK